VRGNTSFLISNRNGDLRRKARSRPIGPILEAGAEEMPVCAGNGFHSELGGTVCLSVDWRGTASVASAVRVVAALGDSRYQSVVGAASRYGGEALVIATTVKLARALWIVPLALATAAARGSKSKVQIPWFIFLFCIAAVNQHLWTAGTAAIADVFFSWGGWG